MSIPVSDLADQMRLARLCAEGYHAWMPWLPITRDDGLILHYVTFCCRCRAHEQYDLEAT